MARWCYRTASSTLLLNTDLAVAPLSLALSAILVLQKFDWMIDSQCTVSSYRKWKVEKSMFNFRTSNRCKRCSNHSESGARHQHIPYLSCNLLLGIISSPLVSEGDSSTKAASFSRNGVSDDKLSSEPLCDLRRGTPSISVSDSIASLSIVNFTTPTLSDIFWLHTCRIPAAIHSSEQNWQNTYRLNPVYSSYNRASLYVNPSLCTYSDQKLQLKRFITYFTSDKKKTQNKTKKFYFTIHYRPFTEPGFAGDIGAIEVWLIDWLIGIQIIQIGWEYIVENYYTKLYQFRLEFQEGEAGKMMKTRAVHTSYFNVTKRARVK